MTITVDQNKLAALNASNAIAAGEDHISSYFSTARLLQMKVWWDTLSHENTPKLQAVYNWANAVTIQAAQGSTDFQESPHTFEELVQEILPLINS